MILSKTPLRISFFSGGSDMPNFFEKERGAALSVTINKYIYVMVHKTPHLGIKIMYDTIEEFPDVEQMQHLITKEALKYFNISKEITIASVSDILSKGSGLGSSSAFTVGLVNALASSKWEVASQRYLADIACQIEMDKCVDPETPANKGNVEKWLLELESIQWDSVRTQTVGSLEEYPKLDRKKWILNWVILI
jgi:D-glycero-alpha-D-manno-heptose-7-phosphate kinase